MYATHDLARFSHTMDGKLNFIGHLQTLLGQHPLISTSLLNWVCRKRGVTNDSYFFESTYLILRFAVSPDPVGSAALDIYKLIELGVQEGRSDKGQLFL